MLWRDPLDLTPERRRNSRRLLSLAEQGPAGWGGRDRTFECWNQNPVPYHLATPQSCGQGGDHIEALPAFQRGENARSGLRTARKSAVFAWLRPRGGIAIRALPRDRRQSP